MNPPARDPNSRTRRTDTVWYRFRVARAYRDVLIAVVFTLSGVALLRVEAAIDQQREGRRVALSVVCAATSAVIDAGRATITGAGGNGARRRAAELYGRTIATRVEAALADVDVDADAIVRPNGSLDCRRLAEIARTR